MDTLYQLFASTLDANPNTRKAAELEMRKLEPQEGMLSSAFQLVSSAEADLVVRQSASIYVKNRIKRSWDQARNERLASLGATPSNQVPIPQSDRDAIKASILQTLITVPAQVRVHVASALGVIARCDFPAQWPDLMDKVGQLISSNEPQNVYGGIRALLEVIRAYKWNDDAALLEPIVSASFPSILNTGRNLLDAPNASSPEVGELIYVILKAYKTSMTSQLTAHQQSNDSIVPWGTFMLNVVQKQVDASSMPADAESRETCSWWKAKKWAYFSLNKLFSRFGNPSQLPSNLERYKPFAEQFVASFAPEILKAYLRQTEQNIAGQQWLSRKAVHFIFMFYTECVKPKSTWSLLKPHVDQLVQSFVFPCICYSDEDDEMWEIDPVDYVRAHLDLLEEPDSPSGSAAIFLTTVAEKRTKTTFMNQLEFINSVVNSYPASRSPREKEGALHMVRALDTVMMGHSKVQHMMEGFFVSHVIPELKSEHRFLRFRACELVKVFDSRGMKWSATENLEAAFRGIMDCMQDPELPVRVQAAEALGELVGHDEVREAMAPNAGRLMQELLKLSDETDLDVLTQTKEKIVEHFSEELLPFAVELTEQMRNSYMRLVQENLEAAERDPDGVQELDLSKNEEDKLFAAMGCLSTIYQIVSAVEEKPHMLEQLEAVLLPMIGFTIEKECVELFDDCFELTDMLTFYQKKISQPMWQLFELMYKSFKSSGIDYLSEMLATFDNFVSYGREVFVQNEQYRGMLLDIFNTAFSSDKLGMSDHIAACKLAEVILLQLKGGSIDAAVPEMINTILPHVANTSNASTPLRKWSVIVVLNAIYYNPVLVLQVLESQSATGPFFAVAMQLLPKYKRVHEKKVAVVALLSLLALPADSLPKSVQEGLPQLMGALISQLDTLPDAIAKRKELEAAFASFEDSVDLESGDESTEFVDENDDDEENDILDEDNEYLELLAREGARLRAQAAAREGGETADFEEDEDEDEDEGEELVYESPLDHARVFDSFREVLSGLQANNAGLYQGLTDSLTPEQQQTLAKVLQTQEPAVESTA